MPQYEFVVRVSADTPHFQRDDAESVIQAVVDNADFARPGMAIPPMAVEVEVGDDVYADVYTKIEVV